MPTEHAAKIRTYTFLSDVAPEGQAKTSAPFLSEQYQKIRRYSSEHCSAYSSEHCSDRTAKPLFCAAVGKEKDGTFFTSTEKYLTKSCNKYRK